MAPQTPDACITEYLVKNTLAVYPKHICDGCRNVSLNLLGKKQCELQFLKNSHIAGNFRVVFFVVYMIMCGNGTEREKLIEDTARKMKNYRFFKCSK